MALTSETLSADPLEALSSLASAISSSLHVAVPGVIESFDPDTVTCVVQPVVKSGAMASDGTISTEDYPLLVDVPVVFPRGGGCTLTFPVRAGDECLVVFADREIDFWWQSGGTQESASVRQHSLSDAFAIPGPRSQAQHINNISTEAAQLRIDDGSAFIELAADGNVRLVTTGKISASADAGVDIAAPTISISGDVTIAGSLSVSGDAIAQGISVSGHTHSGVQGGSGSTGKPQ